MATKKKTPEKKLPNFSKIVPYVLLIAGIIGLIMSFVVMFDEIRIANNPSYVPICNLNPVIACGSVMRSKEASAFGFSNPMIGLAAFPVLITLGTLLLTGVKLKRWIWLGLELGCIFGVSFIHWLFFQSVYRIHALCPFCIGVWIVTIASFWYVTLYNLQAGNIVVGAGFKKFTNFLFKHHLDLYILWLLIIAAFILKHFWYYYGQHI